TRRAQAKTAAPPAIAGGRRERCDVSGNRPASRSRAGRGGSRQVKSSSSQTGGGVWRRRYARCDIQTAARRNSRFVRRATRRFEPAVAGAGTALLLYIRSLLFRGISR